jgi:hypothetical protein
MQSAARIVAVALVASIVPIVALGREPAATSDGGPSDTETISWCDDYHASLDDAQAQRRLVLVWLYEPSAALVNVWLDREVFGRPEIQALVRDRFVTVKLPVGVKVASKGEQIELLGHPAFAEMRGQPGLVVIDMSDPQSPLFRQVVSVYPFDRGPISADKLAVLADLPRGTLTQRTLIFAVRTHTEQPLSTAGHLSPILTRETENHAWHQAQITLQGHHNWESRFHAINARLPGGLVAREVCAESWPGQNLLEAAEECVHSWRQSSGHWEAVRSHHPLFAYDMKRGANGVWYAVGIFASR